MIRNLAYHRKKAKEKAATLSLEEKLYVICGTSEDYERIGLPRFDTGGEAAHGVQARHDQSFDLGEPQNTTIFPNPIGLAATWDKDLLYKVGEVVGVEGRSLHAEEKTNALRYFAPTIDMERDPRWGRNEEAYGEDPTLTACLAGNYINGMAGEDDTYLRAGAMVKHFYANNVEDDRSLKDSLIPEHLKENYYLKVFKKLAEVAQPLSLMTSYNYVNGVPSTFNHEVKDKMKAWGYVTAFSDGGAMKMAVDKQKEEPTYKQAAARGIKAGLDGFLDDNVLFRKALEEAVADGLLSESEIDTAVMNRLTEYSALGLLEPEKAPFTIEDYNMSRVNTKEHRTLSREASAASVVMLKNSDTAPLKGKEVFLFGPFADRTPLDWYSGINEHFVTAKEGLSSAYQLTTCESFFPTVKICFPDGTYGGLEGTKLIHTDAEHAEEFTTMLWDESRITIRAKSNGMLLTSRPPEQKIMNSEEKDRGLTLNAMAKDAFSWFVNEAFNPVDKNGDVIEFTESDSFNFWEDERICGIKNTDGTLALTFETVKSTDALIKEVLDSTTEEQRANIPAICCFGLHPMVNGKEERDRKSIEFPPYQRAVLHELEKHFSKLVLVMCTNSPVAITEEDALDQTEAIYWAPFGSEEYGNALCDIISGKVSPSGCLPQTWYKSDAQLPADINNYDIEKTNMTYLYMKEKPLYRFGYGLSYAKVTQKITEVKADRVCVTVTIEAEEPASIVIQLYKNEAGEYRLYDDDLPCGYRLVDFIKVSKSGDYEFSIAY